MKKPAHVIEIFLQPGDFYFGDRNTRIRTLLGSCVAITMWHPVLLIGGMCHYMLPTRGKPAVELDGRYADEAIRLFHLEIGKAGTKPEDYQVKLFGGGSMFGLQKGDCKDIPCRNVKAARLLLAEYGHAISAEHVGMHGHRNVIFDIWSGKVWMRHVNSITDERR
jgi:chemotaxis protein CheD